MLPRVDVLVLNPAGLCLIKSCITIIAFLVYHQQRMDQNCGMSQDECWNRMSISSMHSNYDQAQNLHLLNQCLIKNFATDGLRIQKLTISYSSFHSNPNPQKEKKACPEFHFLRFDPIFDFISSSMPDGRALVRPWSFACFVVFRLNFTDETIQFNTFPH